MHEAQHPAPQEVLTVDLTYLLDINIAKCVKYLIRGKISWGVEEEDYDLEEGKFEIGRNILFSTGAGTLMLTTLAN